MISNEQKNINILNRFESKEQGTQTRKYTIMVRGQRVTMICMNGETKEEAGKEARLKFQKNFERIL